MRRVPGTISLGLGLGFFAALVGPGLAAGQGRDDDGFPQSGDRVTITGDGAVELHVVDMPLATVLRMLSIQGKQNIIATPAVDGVVTADLYDVTFEQALRAVLITNDCDYQVKGGFLYVYTREELEALETGEVAIASRIFRLNYIRASDVSPVIEPLLSADGKIAASPQAATGIKTSADDAGGDTLARQDFLAVYDYPDRLSEIAKVIRQIDVRPKQVLVEATILRARLTNDNALGIDFSLVGGVDLELLGAASTGVQDLLFGPLPAERFERFNANATTSFTENVPSGGLSLGIIKDHVAVFLRALEQITDVSVLANPKILTLNKQVGNVIVGRRDGYITTTVTETQAIQKVEFLETGTQLTFRPFISDDGYVRMELHPEDSVGGLTAAQLPFEQTTEVTTNVIVRDGHTILVGGLFREVDSDSRSQLPFLGDIPVIGDLFRSRNDALDREEVIILLTVHIIDDMDEYAMRSAEVREDLERSRVVLRGRAMWHGRERLAQFHYRRAIEQYARGQETRALWNIQMSLHNNPRFRSAIALQEEITQFREWEDDTSVASDFVSSLVMRRRGIDVPLFGRAPRAGRKQVETGDTDEGIPADGSFEP